ncbi:MAG: XkdF-like putative serine protease domain-containing protein [Desulfobacterales bacterium]|nr:XkdF-like putative serine protease domain-containing protein [Desulfobacterales bacterium]
MRRVQFNVTGFSGLRKGEMAPVLRVNFADAESACVFHTLQVATDSEVVKAEGGAVEDGVVFDLVSEMPRIVKAGSLADLRAVLQKAVLMSAPVPVVMARYDSDEVGFTGVFNDEDGAVEALVAASDLAKAEFDFDVEVSEGVVQFLRAFVKAGDGDAWRCSVQGSRIRLAKAGTVAGVDTPLAGVRVHAAPQRKAAVPVVKVDLSPFRTVTDFVSALSTAVATHVSAGEFGLAEYRVEGGDVEEMPPRWWYVSEIGDGWLIVDVDFGEAEERCATFRVGYVVSETGEVTIEPPFERVQRATVWIREGEEAAVVPQGTSEAGTGEAGAAGGDDSEEDAAEVSANAKKPYGVPTKKFCVVKTDLRAAAETAAEKRYVLGVVLEPNDGVDAPMNPDTQGDVYSAGDIEKAAHKWMSEFLNVGLMHAELAGRRIIPVESFVVPVDMELGEQKIIKGTWMIGAIIEDPEVWKAVKAGQLTGWSMGGFAVREPL